MVAPPGSLTLITPHGPGRFFTLMPYNVPIHVVVGNPIKLPHVANPSTAQVDDALEEYIAELERIFELHKGHIPGYEHTQLRIL